jgi:hypothetical protein
VNRLGSLPLGSRFHHGGFRRLLLGRADGIEALLQRLHEIDHLRRRIDGRCDDVLARDLGVDDSLKPCEIFVFVVRQVERLLERLTLSWAVSNTDNRVTDGGWGRHFESSAVSNVCLLVYAQPVSDACAGCRFGGIAGTRVLFATACCTIGNSPPTRSRRSTHG